MILRLPETQRCRDACGSGLHGIPADPSAAQELPRAFERPEPFLERRQDNNDDVLLCPEGGRSIWRLFAKPKQARNFKDLKHLKCRYTFRMGASGRSGMLISSACCGSVGTEKEGFSVSIARRFRMASAT